MDKLILISISFTGLGLENGYRGDAWFKRRIELYNKYTFQSLKKQTNQDFIIWLQFRPEEKENPLIKNIDTSHKTIMTFNGICIWDDKKENEEKGLLKRLDKSLFELRDVVGDNDVKLVRLDSDDMYSKEVIESIKNEPFEHKRALTHRNGWIYSYTTDQLAEWNPATNPPFYCLMIDNKTFLDPEKHFETIKGIKSHEYVIKEFNEKRMPDRRYCVVVHNANISTIFRHPFRGAEIWDEETKLNILKDYHL